MSRIYKFVVRYVNEDREERSVFQAVMADDPEKAEMLLDVVLPSKVTISMRKRVILLSEN